MNAQYPAVFADGRAVFRLRAPNATKVQLQPGGSDNGLGLQPIDLTKGADGVWTVTTPPAVPGFHYYWFLVDGVQVNDPGSQTFFGWASRRAASRSRDRGVDFYDAEGRAARRGADATGTCSKVDRASGGARSSTRRPATTPTPRTRYPVLYLQHGAGENETGWTQPGPREFHPRQPDRRQKAVPMIVVMDRATRRRRPADDAANALRGRRRRPN